ncbi:MAG: hypothetical protein OHK0047_37550 [Leptolyngbyaceae cyanobacterium]
MSVGFISKWRKVFQQQGVAGLVLRHRGSTGYLNAQQRQSVIDWLKQKNYWNLLELQQYVEDTYEVVFASNQSYYDLFVDAGISWKKAQKRNPKADTELVERKTGDYDLAGAASSGDCEREIGCFLPG